ncbi:MAG: VanZ family protein [Planctomycetia bacterium]|jgi:VanZ family protein
MKILSRQITHIYGHILVGYLLDLPRRIKVKKVGQSQNTFPEHQPPHTRRQRMPRLRQFALLATTFCYLLVITILLTINSPRAFLSHYFTESGSSIYAFVHDHETAIHFLSFYLLAILICTCFRNMSYWIAIAFMIGYAVLTELLQIPLPDRHSDIGDLLANLAGIGCGAISVWAMLHMMLHLFWKRNSVRE